MAKKKVTTNAALRDRALAQAERSQSTRDLKQAATRRVGLTLSEASAETARERATVQGKAVAGQLKKKLASTARTGASALALADEENQRRRATAQKKRAAGSAAKSVQKEAAALRSKKSRA